MGTYQTYKFYTKRKPKTKPETTNGLGGNIHKCCDQQGLNF